MSWSWPPAEIEFAATSDHNSVIAIPPSTNDYLCPLLVGFATCYHHETFLGVTEEAPISTALAGLADVYDWYTVALSVGFPHVPTAYEDCWTPPSVFHQGCKTNTPGDSNGLLDGVTLKNFATGDTADNTGASPGLGAGWDINSGGPAAVVNPSPAYSVPDSHGNDAGELLWTRAQVEALVVDFIYGGHWGNGNPNLNILATVAAWNDIAVTPTSPPFICLL